MAAVSKVVLKDYQEATANLAHQRLCTEGLSQFLVGSVGAGKTAVALRIFNLLASESGRCTLNEKRPCLVLLLCPNCVLRQWEDEAPRLGIPPENILVYHGDRRRRLVAYEEWGARARASVVEAPHRVPFLCLTTFETFKSDMSNGGFKLRIPWNLVAMDEAHVLRNGVEKSFDEEVKLSLKTYAAIEQHLFIPFRPRMLFITATVVMNHQLDAFSLARWTEMPAGLLIKKEWNERTLVYKRARGHMVAKHVSIIEVPPVPSVTMLVEKLVRSEREIVSSSAGYDELQKRLTKLRKTLAEQGRGPQSELKRMHLRLSRNAFLAAVTRCRRGEIHPYFFEQRVKVVTPIVDGASSAHRPTATRSVSKEPQLTSEDIARVVQEYPLSDCAKMNAVVEWCRSLTAADNKHRKGLVICDYKQPLQILAQYLRESNLPQVAVFEHYGGGGKANVTKIAHFQKLLLSTADSEAAVLLATRGSMGVGVNLYSAQRTFLMNLAWSRADDTQALGRMQRPLVQESHEWFATRTILADEPLAATAEDVAVPKSAFTVEEWMHTIQDSKQNMATELFQDSMVDVDEEDEDPPIVDSVDGAASLEGDAKPMSNSLAILQALLNTKHHSGGESEKAKKEKRKTVPSTSSKKAKRVKPTTVASLTPV
ncbi:hypothetical protein CYMTET_47766 [Cymbomonas tetramitiformis]|uniref:Helicase ATP-binding domain-containing protein n=1 Tax=Cymbomonas tetramitiformis TaxID=36881 RepID=A0AAE0BVM5_9CHLO|nr:hypothetical protein CYMTET_47766 [Cymbomonas tetramitiformis]|eukprot:gene3242-4092_t